MFFFFFFFKQKTAYEMSASLVGSEMCIRDSYDYQGITTSGPSVSSPTVSAKLDTEWWQATHP